MFETTRSADGTRIAFERSGRGDPLIVLGGAFNTRRSSLPLAALLDHNFTVYSVDRRGRGDSSATDPYAVEREVEDLAAVIHAAGGSALVYGHSSGAILALEGAAAGLRIERLAVYEPPYGEDRQKSDLAETVAAALAAEDPASAALAFAGNVMPSAAFAGIEQQAWWPGMVAVAHTLPHDLALVGDGSIPTQRLARITAPTLVVAGGDSEPWALKSVAAVAAAIPGATHHVIDGQDHGVAVDALAPVLQEFFG